MHNYRRFTTEDENATVGSVDVFEATEGDCHSSIAYSASSSGSLTASMSNSVGVLISTSAFSQ